MHQRPRDGLDAARAVASCRICLGSTARAVARPRARVQVLATAVALAVSLCAAPSAWAHAQLLGTVPLRGAVVATPPAQVIFEFNQPVGGTLGAVRVYDAKGDEVDDGDVVHPGGRESWMGVGLKPGLARGTYIATYRVISADTHVVYGGNVFSIGAPSASAATVGQLLSKDKVGAVTEAAFGIVKGLDYVSIALLIGVLSFLALVWSASLREQAGSDPRWAAASDAFTRRCVWLLAFAAALGVLVGLLGIALQGATEAGESLWSSLNSHVLSTVLHSRFGWVWGTRAIVWLALGGLLAGLAATHRRVAPTLATATPGGPEPIRGRAWWVVALALLAVGYVAVTPALSGHASVSSPTGLLFPLDVVHVVAMSVWLGGLVCLVVALPAATRRLLAAERTRLLAGTLVRFSPIALACVVALLLSGVAQAYVHIRSWNGLFHSAYGIAVLIKFVLLMALIALGAINRQRTIPALRTAVSTARSPGEIGVLLRRTLRAEVLLLIVVLGVTSALVAYTPPVDAAAGPFSTSTTLGPADLELTVDPANVGPNSIHLYLINPKDGSQYTATQQLIVQASLPAKGIGPLTLTATPAGPGHYIVAAQLIPGGTWTLQFTDRVSAFDEYLQSIKVPIR